jgi:hypothetical protein
VRATTRSSEAAASGPRLARKCSNPSSWDQEYAKRNLYFGLDPERPVQVRLHHEVAGHSGHFIHTAGEIVFPVIEAGGSFLLFKNFHSPDDRPVRVANRHSAGAHWDFVASLVVQESNGLSGLRCLNGAGHRTIVVAPLAILLTAVQQGLSHTALADHFMAQMAGDALCPIAPHHDFLFTGQQRTGPWVSSREGCDRSQNQKILA